MSLTFALKLVSISPRSVPVLYEQVARWLYFRKKCDPIAIKLLARWHSDGMMQYLHQQSVPIMKNLTSLMFNGGQYSFLPEK